MTEQLELDLGQIAQISEIRELANERMPETVRAFVDADGADRGLLANEKAWDQWALRPRVLVDVSDYDTRTTVLGQEVSFPLIVAPFSSTIRCHPDGELAIAQGAREAGTLMTLSARGFRSPEEIHDTGVPFWVHVDLSTANDRDRLKRTIERGEAAGTQAICLTVDLPLFPPLWPPSMLRAMNDALDYIPYSGVDVGTFSKGTGGNAEKLRHLTRSRFSWKDLEAIRELTDLPLVLKGIQTWEDAQKACELGVEAIIVSNHGGHGSIETLGTADILPEVVEAAAGRCEILIDGGVRTGADILRAVALGATAVMVGRPALWGAAVAGASGVARALGILHEELRTDMALTGARRVSDIDRSMIVRRGEVVPGR